MQALGKPALVYSYTDPAQTNRDMFSELGLPVFTSQRGTAKAAKAASGNAINKARTREDAPDVAGSLTGSLMRCPPRRARSA